jgi:hypothetical protein
MTPEQEAKRREIREARAVKAVAVAEAARITDGPKRALKLALVHKHSYVRHPEMKDVPMCEICDTVLYSRWYCPKSKDHLCHYDKGNEDECDFCGNPEERK